MTGQKRAVLVGCNYPRTEYKLQGCINDVVSIYNTIVHDRRFGFDPHNIVMLTDAPNGIVGTHKKPTGANIKRALGHMIDQAKSGDVLLFHFSGHGTLLDNNKHDDAICPCDFNLITDHDFRILVNRVPHGASFTILSDSCHSGGLIDKEKVQIGPHHSSRSHHHKARGMHHHVILQQLSSMSGLNSDDISNHLVHLYGEDASPQYHSRGNIRKVFLSSSSLFVNSTLKAIGYASNDKSEYLKPVYHTSDDPNICNILTFETLARIRNTHKVRLHEDNGILLSGCQKNESSIDDTNHGKPHGAFTNALLSVLRSHRGPISNVDLVKSIRKLLKEQGLNDQHPCLYCSDANAHRPFLGQK